MKPQMTEACRDLVEGVQHRMKRAKRQALLHPRADRQRFIYDNTFRNEIEAVAYFLAENIGRIPDFNTPETYPELMRGQFLTHPNPLMSIAADKIAMRDYCDLFDLPIRPPNLIATFDSPDELDLRDLPETCMIKINDGCKMHILHGPGMPVTPFAYRLFLYKYWNIDHWRRHAELHYRDIPKRILVEEALLPMKMLREPSVFCAMGDPYVIIDSKHRTALKEHLKPLEFARGRSQSAPLSHFGTKAETDAMLQTARLLSQHLAHCRIDFMRLGDRLCLCEITISPSGYYVPLDSQEQSTLRTDLIDSDRFPDIVDAGRKIAATLGRSPDTSFGHFAGDPRLSTGGQ
ncbi:MAG: ATP-grasp fold amidoligase family protein [Rhodobacteraceae bacterium]|nr:ATP-grasp fold amidoligase family protein [Paracoccaceae bacterium]